MAKTGNGRTYEKRVCPRCGSELYADMGVCYDCLYDFSRERPCEEGSSRSVDEAPETDLTTRLAPSRCATREVGFFASTPSADFWTAVGSEGISVGRGAENDVVLHSLAISRRHLRMVPTPDGMEVSDQHSRNPARYRGRDVRERVIVPYGDYLDLCGCRLTMTGPPSSLAGPSPW